MRERPSTARSECCSSCCRSSLQLHRPAAAAAYAALCVAPLRQKAQNAAAAACGQWDGPQRARRCGAPHAGRPMRRARAGARHGPCIAHERAFPAGAAAAQRGTGAGERCGRTQRSSAAERQANEGPAPRRWAAGMRSGCCRAPRAPGDGMRAVCCAVHVHLQLQQRTRTRSLQRAAAICPLLPPRAVRTPPSAARQPRHRMLSLCTFVPWAGHCGPLARSPARASSTGTGAGLIRRRSAARRSRPAPSRIRSRTQHPPSQPPSEPASHVARAQRRGAEREGVRRRRTHHARRHARRPHRRHEPAGLPRVPPQDCEPGPARPLRLRHGECDDAAASLRVHANSG